MNLSYLDKLDFRKPVYFCTINNFIYFKSGSRNKAFSNFFNYRGELRTSVYLNGDLCTSPEMLKITSKQELITLLLLREL
jgi:hypothetical protein